MFNLFKKKAPVVQDKKRKLVLSLYYSSITSPDSPYGMVKERESNNAQDHQAFRKLYEEELNDGLKKLNEAKDDEFVKILDAVFQKKYFVSFTLSDSSTD